MYSPNVWDRANVLPHFPYNSAKKRKNEGIGSLFIVTSTGLQNL